MTGRVLIVEDVATNRAILEAKLVAAYYDVETAADGPEALAKAVATPPDVILLDVMMPGMDGFETCRRLKADSNLAHIPVVMITALDGASDRIRGLEAGADDFLGKPVDDLALFSRLRSLMRVKLMVDELRLRDETSEVLGLGGCPVSTDIAGGVIQVFEGEPRTAEETRLRLAERLGDQKVRIEAHALDGLTLGDAVALVERRKPDVILAAGDAAGFDGLRFCSQLRANPTTRHAPVVTLAPPGDLQMAATALDLGAADYLLRPVDWCELAVRLRSQLRRKLYADQLRDSMRHTVRLAAVDGLTGVFNRRYAISHLEAMIRRATDAKTALRVMMLDIDRFKSVNDRFGHPAGDAVLKEFATRVSANVRGLDMVARLGGEEFSVALPETSASAAAAVAERVRAAVEAPRFRDAALPSPLEVTVSIGVAAMRLGDDAERLLARADSALYASKNSGRNRVTFADAA